MPNIQQLYQISILLASHFSQPANLQKSISPQCYVAAVQLKNAARAYPG
jgi:hypothetical protein